MTTIVVAGALANKVGNGGEAWVRTSWSKGLQQLGVRVHLLEEIAEAACVDARGEPCGVEESVNLEFFRRVTHDQGIDATLLIDDGRTFGASTEYLEGLVADADLLVNISGHLRRSPLFRASAAGPMSTSIRDSLRSGRPLGSADFDSTSITSTSRSARTSDRKNATSRRWSSGGSCSPTSRPRRLGRLHEGGLESPDHRRLLARCIWSDQHRGRMLGIKVHEFRKYLDLPAQTAQSLELALDIHPADEADRCRLLERGWQLVDPRSVAGDPERFRSYVQGSSGEFSVAQGVYVSTGCGWFSDRTVRYLASGRPALVQDTGFSRHLPTERDWSPSRASTRPSGRGGDQV